MEDLNYLHAFLKASLAVWSASLHVHFSPGERVAGTHWPGRWLGSRLVWTMWTLWKTENVVLNPGVK